MYYVGIQKHISTYITSSLSFCRNTKIPTQMKNVNTTETVIINSLTHVKKAMTQITINKSDSKHRQKCYNYKEADLRMTILVSEPSRRLSRVPGPRHLNWGRD